VIIKPNIFVPLNCIESLGTLLIRDNLFYYFSVIFYFLIFNIVLELLLVDQNISIFTRSRASPFVRNPVASIAFVLKTHLRKRSDS